MNNGGILGGTGKITGDVQVNAGGELDPGTTTGDLEIDGTVTFVGTTSSFGIQLGGTSGTGGPGDGAAGAYDQIVVDGDVNLGNATFDPALELGYLPAIDDVFVIVENANVNATNGVFDGLAHGDFLSASDGTATGQAYFQIFYRVNQNTFDPNNPAAEGTGNDVILLSLGPAETLVAIDGSGNLVITDINNDSTDALTVTFDQGANEWVISDPNLVLGTTIGGGSFTQPSVGEIRVDATAVTGGIIINTTGPDTTTVGVEAGDTVTLNATNGATDWPSLPGVVTVTSSAINLDTDVTTTGVGSDITLNGAATLNTTVALTGEDVFLNGTVAMGANDLTVSVTGSAGASSGGISGTGQPH